MVGTPRMPATVSHSIPTMTTSRAGGLPFREEPTGTQEGGVTRGRRPGEGAPRSAEAACRELCVYTCFWGQCEPGTWCGRKVPSTFRPVQPCGAHGGDWVSPWE